MSRLLETTRVQDRGVVTIPDEVRQRLGLSKGSTVVFVENEAGRIEIRTLDADLLDALDRIGVILKEEGITLDDLTQAGRRNRKQMFEKRYPDLA